MLEKDIVNRLLFCLLLLSNKFTITYHKNFKLGLENIPDSILKQLQIQNVGLITNQSGKSQGGKRNIDILREHNINIKYIFGPEHGFKGKIGAEQIVKNGIDAKTNIPIISLYGNGTGKKIHSEKIKKIDTLLFDIQDSGMRHYTYISTLLHAMQDAVKYDKKFIILDRPNPLAARMEGPLVQSDLISFISIAPIPLRHGMTMGELGCYFNKHILKKPVRLRVIKMKNYDRHNTMNNKLIAPLSPGIRSIQSCYNYSFLGLLGEIRPFDIGLKSEAPFQCILLPKKIKFSEDKWYALQTLLKSHNIESKKHRRFNEKTKTYYSGLRLYINNINMVSSFNTFIAILDFFKKNGVSFSYSKSFNIAIGTRNLKKTIAGLFPRKKFLETTNKDLKAFFKKAEPLFMYKPFPKITQINLK